METDKARSASPKVCGETAARIIKAFGSEGFPSCGLTDAKNLGSGGNQCNTNIGGTDYEIIKPNTSYSFFPFSLLGKLLPHKLPKSPRNYQKFLEEHLSRN